MSTALQADFFTAEPLGSLCFTAHSKINFFKFFFIWTLFKVFIEFVTILLLSYVLLFDQEAP